MAARKVTKCGYIVGTAATGVTLTGSEQNSTSPAVTGHADSLTLYIDYTPSSTGRDGNSRLFVVVYGSPDTENPSTWYQETEEVLSNSAESLSTIQQTLKVRTFKDKNDGTTTYKLRYIIPTQDRFNRVAVYETKTGANYGVVRVQALTQGL